MSIRRDEFKNVKLIFMINSRLQKLLAYLRPYWQQTLLGVFAISIVNAIGVYIRLLIGDTVDELLITFSFEQIWRFVLIILLLASFMWAIRMAS
ncbi:MAG: hypothetical protein F6K31_11390, partial [Symploca sp. SIO2G7]|nr:hypothetical protein [Symploca sp. SIO2G7]